MKRALLLIAVLGACKAKSSEPAATKVDQDRDVGGSKDSGLLEPPKPTKTGGGKGGFQLDLDGAIEVGAGIDKDVVRKVVKDNTSKLQYCYEKTLLANPGIEGKVLATFTIGTDGSVGEVKAAGVHPDVESCVADAVKAFKFPPSPGKVEVSYPFTFKPA